MADNFPFEHHPCWSNARNNIWERIHLPVAKKCNVQCGYCGTRIGLCSSLGPGGSEKLVTPQEAITILQRELNLRPRLRIVGISGPGEPLYNNETFVTLGIIHDSFSDMRQCMSTNGLLLKERSHDLSKLEVDTISVSMSAINPQTVEKIYRWAILNEQIESGRRMAEEIITLQLEGIKSVSEIGIRVKVNTVLIPNLNSDEISDLAQAIRDVGASIQNIIPLIPRGEMANVNPPNHSQVSNLRNKASQFIPQFFHCKQCRSDVVGIPGHDSVL